MPAPLTARRRVREDERVTSRNTTEHAWETRLWNLDIRVVGHRIVRIGGAR